MTSAPLIADFTASSANVATGWAFSIDIPRGTAITASMNTQGPERLALTEDTVTTPSTEAKLFIAASMISGGVVSIKSLMDSAALRKAASSVVEAAISAPTASM